MINGGFFVLSPQVLDYIADDNTIWEREPLERLAEEGELGGIPARGILAADGHPARQDASRGIVAIRQGAVEGVEVNPAFWHGKRVLLTGHTGFKGSWLSLWLQSMGAQVTGYALAPPTNPSLFEVAEVGKGMTSIIGDIRDLEHLRQRVRRTPAGDRDPHGGPAAGALFLRRAGRDLLHQRDGHGEPARSGAQHGQRQGRGQRDQRQVLREPRMGVGLPRERSDGRLSTPTAAARAARNW